MKISDRNFMASQAFYGLSITHQARLNAAVGKKKYKRELRRLVKASYFVADAMLDNKPKGNRYGRR